MIYRRRKTRAYTLLELVAATAIAGMLLVGTMALMRDSMALSRKVEVQNDVSTLCVSKLEEHLAEAAAKFTSTTSNGSFASDGRPEICFSVVCSDSPLNGGISGRLMSVISTVWEDVDNNKTLGPDEVSVTLASKVAKMALYQNEAKPLKLVGDSAYWSCLLLRPSWRCW